MLAEMLSATEGVAIDPDTVETNIVIFQLTGKRSAADLVARLKKRNILMSAVGKNVIRMVTHLDVNRAACVAASEALAEEIEAA